MHLLQSYNKINSEIFKKFTWKNHLKSFQSRWRWWWRWWIVFCCMVDQWKTFSLISSRDSCQRSSPSWISDTPQTVSKRKWPTKRQINPFGNLQWLSKSSVNLTEYAFVILQFQVQYDQHRSSNRRFYRTGCSYKFPKFYKKTHVLESLFNKITDLKPEGL